MRQRIHVIEDKKKSPVDNMA